MTDTSVNSGSSPVKNSEGNDQKADKTENGSVEEVNDFTKTEEYKAAVARGVDETVKARVAREQAKTVSVQKELDEVLSKLAELETSSAEVTKRLDETSRNATLYKVAFEEAVTLELVSSLRGETEDELKSGVQAVKQSVGQPAQKKSVDDLFTGKAYIKNNDSLIDELMGLYSKE